MSPSPSEFRILILGSGNVGVGINEAVRKRSLKAEIVGLRTITSFDNALLAKLENSTHLIWAGRDVPTINGPRESSEAFFQELIKFLETRKAPLHLVYISSGGAIYGNAVQFPTSETHPLNPISEYGMGKKRSELRIEDLVTKNSLVSPLILRPANLYSFGDTDRSLISSIDRSISNGTNLSIAGGSQTRDFVSLENFAHLVINFCLKKLSGTFNIGTGFSYSVNEVLAMFERSFSKKLFVTRRELPLQEVLRSELDVSKIRPFCDFDFVKINEAIEARGRNMGYVL